MKAFFCLAFLCLLTVNCLADTASKFGKSDLTENDIFGYKISFPKSLQESFWEDRKVDPQKIRVFDNFDQTETIFFNRMYSDLNFDAINILYAQGNSSLTENFEFIKQKRRINFEQVTAFVITGQKDGRYTHDYYLFNKNKEWLMHILILGTDDYFLTEEEADYIISTLKI